VKQRKADLQVKFSLSLAWITVPTTDPTLIVYSNQNAEEKLTQGLAVVRKLRLIKKTNNFTNFTLTA
jgi:hypothetical protein